METAKVAVIGFGTIGSGVARLLLEHSDRITRQAGRRRYRIQVGAEIPVRRSGDVKADLVENTARFTAAIEAMIREQPEQWFWVHRRWKTRHPVDARLRPQGAAPQTTAIEPGRGPAG